MATPFRNNTR